MGKIHAVLFDLDGTLLDTVPDLVFALNQLRKEHAMPELSVSAIRPIASLGSKAMIKLAFNMSEQDSHFNSLREKFLDLYEKHLADTTQFFPNVETVLSHLESKNIPWGIVTNKLTRHTHALLNALRMAHRPACIVCGDSLSTYKPDPEPIRYACQLLKLPPDHCLYVGDASTDVIASKAAGTQSLVALYGYIHADEKPFEWQADGYIRDSIEIIDWIEKQTST